MKTGKKILVNRGISLVLCFFMVIFSAVPVGAESIFLSPDFRDEAGTEDINNESEVTTGSSIKGNGIKAPVSTAAGILYAFEGEGSKSNPYIISTEDDLRNMAAEINAGSEEYNRKYFEIKEGSDITLTGEWMPIGTEENPFAGYFDGSSQAVKNVKITSPSAIKHQGFFGYSQGTITDLTVTGIIESDADYVGGIAGYSEGEIINCTFGMNGESYVKGNNYVGGIAGYSAFIQTGSPALFNKLENHGRIEGKENVGGIYGCISGSENGISYVELNNTGDVQGSTNTGGIIGFAADIVVFSNSVNAINKGRISAEESNGGGIAGYLTSSLGIYNGAEVTNKGSVETGVGNVGGIVGYSSRGLRAGNSSNITNEGKITAFKSNAGGIIGSSAGMISMSSGSKISNEGEVTAFESNAGGIVGLGSSSAWDMQIRESEVINRGNIKTQGNNSGGIVGSALTATFTINSKVTNDGKIEALSSAGGIIGSLSGTLNTGENAQIANEGSIEAKGSNAGGIIGSAENSNFDANSKVTNEGTVEVKHDNSGGIAGSAKRITIRENAEVANTGSVKTGNNNAGGIVGLCTGDINSVAGFLTNNGDVTASGSNAGGITGKTEVPEGKNFIVSKVATAGGSIHASKNAGGIVGYADGKLTIGDSYNKAAVSADDSSEGGIIASASNVADISVSDSFSYIIDGSTIMEIPLTKVSGAVIQNSYYLVGDTYTEGNNTAKKADEFRYGRMAYIIDIDAAGKRKSLWGQKVGTDLAPAHYDSNNGQHLHPMVYKNQLQKNMELTDVTVEFDIKEGSIYKLYDNSVYMNRGNEVKLTVSGLNEKQLLLFSPPGFVIFIGNEYKLTGNETDTLLIYSIGERVAADTFWYSPGGRSFELNTEAQLLGLAELVSAEGIDFKDKTIVLVEDINLATSIWIPIGTKNTPFRGRFEAKENPEGATSAYASINNFNFTVGDAGFGVFGYVESATVKNLCVNGSVTAISTGGGNIAGIAANSQNSSFINCVNNVNITGTGTVGGITGVADSSTYEDCINPAHIYSSKTDGYVGGIAALSSGSTFDACKNEGHVQAAGSSGGIASKATSGNIFMNCVNEGIVEGSGYTGGVVGNIPIASSAAKTRVTGCSNSESGTVRGTGSYSGGITGMAGNLSVLKNCFNSGLVDSRTDKAGGVAGALASGAVVEGCYNSEKGTVKNKGQYTAGVFGSVGANTKLEEIFNAGTVTGDGDYTAGVFAYGAEGMFGNVERCYNTGTVQGNGLFASGICADLRGEKKYSGNQTSYLQQCYNIGTVKGTGDDTKTAGITGTNYVNAAGSYCSYVVDCYNLGSVEAAKSANAAAISALNWQENENSYYLEGSVRLEEGMKPADYKNAAALDKYAFESGKAAYLLDRGGMAERKKIWGQGDGYPVPAVPQNNPVYKITIGTSGPPEGFEGSGDDVNKVKYNDVTASKESIVEIYATAGKEIKLGYSEKTGYLLNTVSAEEKKIKVGVDEEAKAISLNTDDSDLKIDVNFIKVPGDLKPYYTVIYNANGGHWGELIEEMPQRVNGGCRAKEPVPPPSRYRHPGVSQKLTGWYKDAQCTMPYDFTAVVISDMTLYASWQTFAQHSVIFDANGGSFKDSQVVTVSVDDGQVIKKPLYDPTKDGYEFRGWYTDEDCYHLYDFNRPVTGGFTLYAGWVEKGKCVVVFDGNGGIVKNGDEQAEAVAVTVAKGEKISSLKAEREPEGTSTFEFKGWYTQDGAEWDFYDTVEDSMTLTAQWNENLAPGEYEIGSLEALETLRDEVNEGNTYEESIFRLTADIKLPEDWISIGYIATPTSNDWDKGFRGTFDGGGHTIIIDNYQKAPVFGVLGYGGVVTNINIKGNHVYSISVPLVMSSHGEISDVVISGEFYRCASGVALEAYSGLISNCTIKSGSVIDGDGAVGGILALSRSNGHDDEPVSIDHCVVEQGVRISARDGDDIVQSLGGIVAYSYGTVEYCVNGADLIANYTGSSGLVGGIVGTVNSNGSSSIVKCVNTGNIVTTGGTVGGIAGSVSEFQREMGITYCYSTGNIKSTGDVDYLGGIGGNVSGIVNSYWYGEFLDVPEGTENFGAITGYAGSDLSVENCYYGVQASGSFESKETIRDLYDGKGSTKLTAEEFEMGKAAYLIDGGEGVHEDEWTQDFKEGYPVFGIPSMYMITINSTGPGYIEINNRKDIAFWGEGWNTVIRSFPDESTETAEYKLDKIFVSDPEGNSIDCSIDKLEYKMPARNVTISAEFTAVDKPVIPLVEPDPDEEEEPGKSDNNDNDDNDNGGAPSNGKELEGGGIGDGDGIGDGTGSGIGEGTGGGTDIGADGNQGGTSGDGAEKPSYKSEEKKNENAAAVTAPEQTEDKEVIVTETKPAEEPEDEQIPPEPEEEHDDPEEHEDEASDVFKTLQDNIKENPKMVAAIVLIILLINGIIAFIRYKKLKK